MTKSTDLSIPTVLSPIPWRRFITEVGEDGISFDIGCPDFLGAAANRKRIKEGFALDWWRLMEQVRDSTGLMKRLPDWVPTNNVRR